MNSTEIKELQKLVVQELLPVYLKYHEQQGIPVPKAVATSPLLEQARTAKPVAALLQAPKILD